MEAKNLRLGNIVRSKINGISKVEQIGSSINSEYVGGRSLEGNYWENSCLPVEINEQWLIDFGFRKDEETNYRWFMEDWLAYDLMEINYEIEIMPDDRKAKSVGKKEQKQIATNGLAKMQ